MLWFLLLAFAAPASGELTGLEFRGHRMNFPSEVAHIIQKGHGKLSKVCDMEPEFVPAEKFYVLSCAHTALTVDIVLHGDAIFMNGGGIPNNIITLDLPKYQEPHIRSVTSCPNGTYQPGKDCDKFTFDIFRDGGDFGTLATLGIASKNALSVFMTPDFQPHIMDYETKVRIGEPFSITASSAEYKTLVGIEYKGTASSGLGDQDGCKLATRKHMRWDLPGFDATGMHPFDICAIAPDHEHMLKYRLNVTVEPKYSEELKSIKADPFPLTEDFDPHHSIYEVKIPEERFRQVTEVTIKVVANDTEAKISFSAGGDKMGEPKTGENSVVIKTHGLSETPEWTTALTIKVTSADERKSKSYLVKVRQLVSTFCQLKNITVGDTACVLTPLIKPVGFFTQGTKHPDLDGFHPNHTFYKCIWEQETGKAPKIVAHQDFEKCKFCTVRVPDPASHENRHLSVSFMKMDRLTWKELIHQNPNKEKYWSRDFLYGEYHTMPIQVISADQYTDCTYRIYLERWAPWYMRVQTTRFVSRTAMTLSSLMSFTGAANFMALAKQVQFMTLTIAIHGVPEVYRDFAHALKVFDLDISGFVPDVGLPSKADFVRFKEKMLGDMQSALGITQARLLVHYCYAKKFHGRYGGNAILFSHPNDTKTLLAELEEGLNCTHGNESKHCKQNKGGEGEQEGKEGEDAKEGEDDKEAKEGDEAKDGKEKEKSTARRLRGTAKARVLKEVEEIDFEMLAKPRRLSLEEELEDELEGDDEEEEDEKEYPDIWEWGGDDWSDLFTKADNASITETTYEDIDCSIHPLVEQILSALVVMHQMSQFRNMIESTTGSFVIVIFGGGVMGALYIVYWKLIMQHSQRRLKVFEPGPFWIFVADYTLISFSKVAATLAFQDKTITFFVWTPSRQTVQGACILGIILYPLAFTAFVMWSICKLTGKLSKPGEQAKLIYNTKSGQWLDPTCHDMRVTVEAKVPKSVPLIPQLLTKHVRACVPILDQEGDTLTFGDDEDQIIEGGKKVDPLAKMRADRKKGQKEDKAETERQLKRMDEGIQAELASLSSEHNAKHRKMKEERLKREAALAHKVEEWKKRHAVAINERRLKLRELTSHGESNSEPPWFAIATKNSHRGRSWIGGWAAASSSSRPRDEEVVKNPYYMNLKLNDLIDIWQSTKNRNDNEVLDNEERFSILQYIENHIREERKLLKYNILKVVPDSGYLKPGEPLKVERDVHADEQVRNVGLHVSKSSTTASVQTVDPGTWADEQHIKVGNEILALNGTNVSHLSEREIANELQNTRPLKITLRPGSAALPKFWLPDENEYLRDDYEDGHHPWLEEFSANSTFIENDRNERLVYLGDTGTCLSFSSLKTGTGVKAGVCEWMGEPDVGWPIWERQNLKEMGAHNSSMRYADKWQWLICDFCELPWCMDESSESVVDCGCLGTIRKANVPFHTELRKAICVQYQYHVPSIVSPSEKIEIRKWMWAKLKTPMEIKLKLSFLADQHPKFYRAQTLADVAVKDFHTVMFMIETAKPNEHWLRDFGTSQFVPSAPVVDKKTEFETGRSSMSLKEKEKEEKQRQREERRQAVQINQLELLEYTLMKLEDLYPFDGEPWWAEADARAKDKGEIKVMFDHDIFWREQGDPRLQDVRADNTLIPANGYYSSAMFMEHPGETVGTKRYRIVKPDDSMTPINCVMTMGHILPLMRYTENFKLNVPIDALDLPNRSVWQIVLGDKKRGEEFNYCVDRGTTLISIICICAQVGGLRTALIFAAMKFITLVNCVWTAYKAAAVGDAEEEEEFEVDQQVQIPLNETGETEPLLASTSNSNANISSKSLGSKGSGAPGEEQEQSFLSKLVAATLSVDVGVLVLQTTTLLLLAFGQATMPSALRMNEALCALACVLVCSTTMVFTNIFTFQKETKKLAAEGQEVVKGMQSSARAIHRQVREILAGENIFGIEFITSEREETEQIIKAEKVSIVVPDLGIHFDGEPDIDESMPIDEIRQMEMLKQVAFFVMQRESADDQRPLSARELARYDKDIHNSLAVALSTEQMMLCAKIPQVVATIQCINHENTMHSKPKYDNYLTLFKPDDWEPEFDQDKKRVQMMLEGWKVQVRAWFKESLGAVHSERTCTKKIEGQLFNLLRRECTGSLHRDLFAIKVKQVSLPAKGSAKVENLLGKVGYISVLYDNENVKSDFPEDRTSGFGKFVPYMGPSASSGATEEVPEDIHFDDDEEIPFSARRRAPLKRHDQLAVTLVIDTLVLVEMPLGASKVRFSLWVQVDEGIEELVAFSSEVDLVNRAEHGQDQVLEFYMHTKWKHSRNHSVTPIGGEDLEEEELMRKEKLAQDEEEVKSGCRRCWDKFTGGLKYCITCGCCCRRANPADEILCTKGIIEVEMRKANPAEQEEDFKMMVAVQDSTEGQSSLTLSKLDRHKDQFVELCTFFGVRLWDADVEALKEHLEKMDKVNKELWPAAERRKSAKAREEGLMDRQKMVLGHGIRRQLEDCEEMERAKESLVFGIQKVEEQLKKEKDAGVNPQPAYAIKKKFCSGRQVFHQKTHPDSNPHVATTSMLLDELVKFRVAKTKTAKSILHYVVVSDHLKPGKNWRPDAIVPHVASIVTNDMDDIPEVRLSGGKRRDGMDDVIFKRQLKDKKNEPVILNGRLVFKAMGQVFPELNKQIWLYWDGNARWVISPRYGVPVPYGLDQQTDFAAQFMWSKDPAVTPDKIVQPWMIWARTGTRNSVERRPAENSHHPKRWASDLTLRIDSGVNTVSKRRRKFDSFAKTEADTNDEGGVGSAVGGMLKEAAGEIVSLFSLSGHHEADSCLHECLISMDASYLSFAWKDLSIERLAPFRKFLLNEFGTYQSAWLYITRQITMPRPLGQRNLANIFRHTLDLIELDDKERELEKQDGQEDSVLSPSVGSPTSTAKRKQMLKKKTGSMLGGMFESSTNLGGRSEDRQTGFHMSERSMLHSQGSQDGSMTLGGTFATSATMRSSITRFQPDIKDKLRAFLTKRRAWDKGHRRSDNHHRVMPGFSWIGRGRKGAATAQQPPQAASDVDFDQLAAHIMDALDKPPKDGSISIEEIRSLYDDTPEEALLTEFKQWLKTHPVYCDIEYFWEVVSEDVEISLEDFKKSTERLMLKFRTVKREEVEEEEEEEVVGEDGQVTKRPKRSHHSHHSHHHEPPPTQGPGVLTAAEKAEHVFADLDAQNMSGGISYREIRPFSGERFEDAEKSMLHFKIPLSHVKEIVCQGHLKKFASDKRCIRFHINEQFENHKPWRDFRLALNPDWEPARNNESVQVCMLPQVYDLWKQVIRESEMVVPQEWVRYYEGEYKEHPLLTGTYMRHGEGIQRWANGQVFAGEWVNHLYEGYGTLWNSMADYTSKKAQPIYDGQWERGKQHGEGTLRYEQDIFDRRGRPALTRGQHSGRSKIYEGKFRDGLFHGRGVLRMERAVAQYQSGPSRKGPDACVGFVPAAILEPASIIYFDGVFESDWEATDKEIREADPVYNTHNPSTKMDLKLETLKRSDRRGELFKRFFAMDKSKVQKSGASPPDLAVTAYQLKGGDGIHMKHAILCRYADGTEYTGPMLRGKPHGKGEKDDGVSEGGSGSEPCGTLTQYEVQQDGDKGEKLAEYVGQFECGERHGVGRHETWDGVIYEGQWEKNKRKGQGEQKVPEELREALGFALYTGQWENDMKHGQGKMYFGDEGNLLYDGDFENGLRHGTGQVYLVKLHAKSSDEPQLLYQGKFQEDVPHATRDEKVWTHLVVAGDKRGRFFYGQLDDDGRRCGEGTIYDEDADTSEEFLACFKEGRQYTAEDVNNPKTWRFITYHGPFKNDLPHGDGRQHFHNSDKRKSGFYKGQFVEGKRHGRGEWETGDGKRKYRPINAEHVANWENDLMHGIAIVEDKDHVHENVIYAHGRCQMPFTDMGPPLTGFDNTFLVGGLVKGVRMTKMAMRGDALQQQGPGASIASTKKKHSFFGFGREDHAQGVNIAETKAVQQITNTARATHKANGPTVNFARTEEEQELVVVGLVREDTDLSLPEEDVLIKGGTGENAPLNGLYFKLSGTYGMPIYKMAKREHRHVTVRYLFRDIKSNCWVISPKTNAGLTMAAACAFVDDDEADKPGAITADWYVWYPPKRAMKCYGDDDEEGIDPKKPLDRITAVSIVGFEISGVDRTLVSPGIMLRHAKELYGRPVYEAESGSQFLYWMRAKGSLAQGMMEDDSEFSGVQVNHEKLWANAGYWIIASEVGELIDSPKCLAYIEDLAVTPNLIAPGHPWCVAVETGGKRVFHKSPLLKLNPEEWSRNATLLDTFDEDERGFASEARTLVSSEANPPKSILTRGS